MSHPIKGFSTALYGWMERFKREGIEYDWHKLYRACAEAGAEAVETDAAPEKLAIARSYGLQVSASYIGIQLHHDFAKLDVDRSVLPWAERLAAAGGDVLLLNADRTQGSHEGGADKTEDDFKRQGENMTRIAELIRSRFGLRTAMHNHAADSWHADGDLRSVLEYADASLGLCVDTGWAIAAGQDPIAWVRDFPERIYAYHFRNGHGSTPTEDLLEGDVNFPALLAAIHASGYSGWLGLELWHPDSMTPERSMSEDFRRSIEYVRSLL
ncbi:sugar phosphate isomerase/epimerase [Paenibacillus taihuensis]|uniref:Sugar phosphate isomerase/epimerase n=1 Tax=Paenibacillus taihuensis TaxID=1156355 RepID=A0A3D9SDR5_9BACL|nr:sugar phosphate isomerase/epimerase family protein [Paenibacillus taihuensis]REE92727.1 sugar phosphate isomerase/epimerase [Paenibacillus taihuensis]